MTINGSGIISNTTVKPTPFQQRVYDLISKIPIGKFTTYQQIAISLKSSPRAVGQALKRNPYAPTVPCHRVITSDYKLGGYYGKLQNSKKIKLLESEGLSFTNEYYLENIHIEKLYKFQ